MFNKTEIAKISERYNLALNRIRNNNIKIFEGHKNPVLLISDEYPGIWLEHVYDSIILAKIDKSYLDIAKNTLCLFLDNQKQNGQLPCYVTDKSKGSTLPEFGFSQTQECVSFTRLCYEYYEISKDTEFLEHCYNKCKKWQCWYETYRMPSEKGLIEMFGGFDCGHDCSTRLSGMKYIGTAKDLKAEVYPDDDDVLPMICPDLNAVYYGTLTALSDMATVLGRKFEADKWTHMAEDVKHTLMEICFDKETCFFYDVDKNGSKRDSMNISITNVLSEHALDFDLAKEIIEKHMLNPNEFFTEFPFPAVSKSDKEFCKNANGNSWNYYSQALTMLRCTRWMDYYGYSDIFEEILEKWVKAWAMTDKIMFGQELDPFSGEPSECSEWYSSCMLIYIYAVRRLKLI